MQNDRQKRVYFNPRTHEECDKVIPRNVRQVLDFNPRTHEECDADNGPAIPKTQAISIHALTRSATHRRSRIPRKRLISIHALTRSATKITGTKVNYTIFQSTHSRGVRRGADHRVLQRIAISIHALTRSATVLTFKLKPYKRNFNPRTHEECDSER